jgi:hypothetical protein
MKQRKEVKTMKIATSFFAGVLFIGTMGVINTIIADDSIASEADLTPDNYCHKKFPAIKESTLHYVQPTLKDSKTCCVWWAARSLCLAL